jgi:hypothetical protein
MMLTQRFAIPNDTDLRAASRDQPWSPVPDGSGPRASSASNASTSKGTKRPGSAEYLKGLLHYPDGRRAALEVTTLAADGQYHLNSILRAETTSGPMLAIGCG